MKIIINAMSAETGGIATYTNNLAHSLFQRKVEVTFALSNEFNLEADVPIIRLPAYRMRPFQRVIWEQSIWRRIVKKYKPDILFSSANFGLLISPVPQVLLMREGGLFDPFYLTNIGSSLDTGTIFKRIARRHLILASARSSKLILTPSEAMKNLLITWAEDLSDRIEVNRYGTVPMFFKKSTKTRPWKKDGILKLLYISAYYPHKQPGMISEATAQLNALGIPSHLTVTMDLNQISNTKGGEKDFFMLKKGVERGHVTMAGSVPYTNLPNVYSNHDLFIFPSISETFGHPLVEAMAMEIPIVASDTPTHREVCKNSALYFSPLYPSELVEQIQHLDQNEILRASLIKDGLKNSSRNFIWEAHVDRLLTKFQGISKS
jgi:glycosyltransferase involved in cell wall biosynthesis